MINEQRTITLGTLKITAYINSEEPNRYVLRKNGGPATLSQEEAKILANWINGTLPGQVPPTLSIPPYFKPDEIPPVTSVFEGRKASSLTPRKPVTFDGVDMNGVETFDMSNAIAEASNVR